jgi:hypothetical protein
MQQAAYSVSPSGFAYHPFQDIQAEKRASEDHLPEMRISHGYRADLHSKTTTQSRYGLYLIDKGGVVM